VDAWDYKPVNYLQIKELVEKNKLII